MATSTELYKKYVEKVSKLHKLRKRRSLECVKGLEGFLGNFSEIANSLELHFLTKSHVIGLNACMGNLKVSESALGFFSDPFVDLAEALSNAIVDVTKKNAPQGTSKVVQGWLEITVITLVGLLELVREKKLSKEELSLDAPFRDELILTLLFHTKYPKFIFKQMAEGLEIPEENHNLFIGFFESVSLIFALIAYSKDEEIREDLGEALSANLKQIIKQFLESLEQSKVKAYLELAMLALEKGEIYQLSLALQDLMNEMGYPNELLIKDVSAMKALFKRLKIAYFASTENSTNMVHMIG